MVTTTKRPTKQQKAFQQFADLIRGTERSVLAKCVNMCDGHSIYSVKDFTKHGLDEEAAKFLVTELKSGTGKEQLYNNEGQPVKSITGIWGLTFLRRVAAVFDLKYPPKFGRGSEAYAIQEAFSKYYPTTYTLTVSGNDDYDYLHALQREIEKYRLKGTTNGLVQPVEASDEKVVDNEYDYHVSLTVKAHPES